MGEQLSRGLLAIVALLVLLIAPAAADELWVAPTYQQDVGGLGVGSNIVWPVSAIGVSRFAWGIPDNLRLFRSAKIAFIPHGSGTASLNVIACDAERGQLVTNSCGSAVTQTFAITPNQLVEVDITNAISPHVGTAGVSNIAVVAWTSGTTSTDHLVGLRFTYDAGAAPACFDNANRYANCGNGTVTDAATGLIWLRQADCLGVADWAAANILAARLRSGDCGLTDGSAAGDWRLPTVDEWQLTISRAVDFFGCKLSSAPSLTNDPSTACLASGPSSFEGVVSDRHWSQTSSTFTVDAWYTSLLEGNKNTAAKTLSLRIWPVRSPR